MKSAQGGGGGHFNQVTQEEGRLHGYVLHLLSFHHQMWTRGEGVQHPEKYANVREVSRLFLYPF